MLKCYAKRTSEYFRATLLFLVMMRWKCFPSYIQFTKLMKPIHAQLKICLTKLLNCGYSTSTKLSQSLDIHQLPVTNAFAIIEFRYLKKSNA